MTTIDLSLSLSDEADVEMRRARILAALENRQQRRQAKVEMITHRIEEWSAEASLLVPKKLKPKFSYSGMRTAIRRYALSEYQAKVRVSQRELLLLVVPDGRLVDVLVLSIQSLGMHDKLDFANGTVESTNRVDENGVMHKIDLDRDILRRNSIRTHTIYSFDSFKKISQYCNSVHRDAAGYESFKNGVMLENRRRRSRLGWIESRIRNSENNRRDLERMLGLPSKSRIDRRCPANSDEFKPRISVPKITDARLSVRSSASLARLGVATEKELVSANLELLIQQLKRDKNLGERFVVEIINYIGLLRN